MIVTHPEGASLSQMLRDARSRTVGLIADLSGSQLLGPRLSIVNPPLWEIGHLGWFQERWCLRRRGDGALAPSMLEGADALYDSSAVPHDTRWDLPLPALEATLEYLEAVLDRVSARLLRPDPDLAYFAELCALHEEMHAEAFTYTRQTLGMRAPPHPGGAGITGRDTCAGDAEIPGGELMLGAPRDSGFVFDNEKWAHPVRVEPFRIARAAVDNRAFAQFTDDGGYTRRDLWSAEGWAWREGAAAGHPVYWQKMDGIWHARRYDALRPLVPEEALVHVNWHEAQAYCRWAGRRLPAEAEWEFAAATAPGSGLAKRRYPWGDQAPDPGKANLFGAADGPVAVGALAAGDSAWGCRQMIGNVWEWTADAFRPYPGFVADPYAEYSQPWFGDHKVLRGGAHATRACLIRNTWRNFYTPDRRDVFAGFRTCAA